MVIPVGILTQYGEDEEQVETGKGDQVFRDTGMVVITGWVSAPAVTFPAFLTEVDRNPDLFICPLSVTDVSDVPAVRG